MSVTHVFCHNHLNSLDSRADADCWQLLEFATKTIVLTIIEANLIGEIKVQVRSTALEAWLHPQCSQLTAHHSQL